MSDDAIKTARELATHAADIDHLQRDMDKLITDMDEIKRSIASINTTLSEAKGGWRVLIGIAGASGIVGAGLMQILHWWNK
jgi:hypothetical protein